MALFLDHAQFFNTVIAECTHSCFVAPPAPAKADRVLRIRDALLGLSQTVAVEDSLGRILASPSVSCPPAVPIIMCGERIDEAAMRAFRYYGVEKLRIVQE